MRRLLLLAFGFFCLVSTVEKRTLYAAEADLKQAEFFEKRIRPLLIAECYDCHSEDSVESGLRVDSLSGLIRGGERGPALVPGKPKESLLISAVQHSGQLHISPMRVASM